MGLEMYPRRLRVYYASSSSSTLLPPAYISISRNASLSSLIEKVNLSTIQSLSTSHEIYRVDVDIRIRPWGDLTPLSIENFCQLKGERNLVIGTNPSEGELENTVGGAPLDLQDSIVVVNALELQEALQRYKLHSIGEGKDETKVIGSLGLFNLCVCYVLRMKVLALMSDLALGEKHVI